MKAWTLWPIGHSNSFSCRAASCLRPPRTRAPGNTPTLIRALARGSVHSACYRAAAVRERFALLGAPRITLRDGGNRDDGFSRARRAPAAVKLDAEERFLIAAAEERAMDSLRAGNAAYKGAIGREDVNRAA